jgi:hypothetical protein
VSRGLGATAGFEQEINGYYPTPPRLTIALLEVEKFRGGVWECACGEGAMSQVLIGHGGLDVVSTDLVHRGYGRGGVDYLRTRALKKPNVITNPPFKHWDAFARHSVGLRPRKIALLGRLLLLEGWERWNFFMATGLSRVWMIGREKMRPPDTEDRGFGPTMCFAWFVWDFTRPRPRRTHYDGHRGLIEFGAVKPL